MLFNIEDLVLSTLFVTDPRPTAKGLQEHAAKIAPTVGNDTRPKQCATADEVGCKVEGTSGTDNATNLWVSPVPFARCSVGITTSRWQAVLWSDHVIQKGPSFKHPMETSIDVSTGQVMARYTDDDGKEQTINEQLTLPADVANGLLFTLVRHIQPSVPQTIVSQVAMTPKPRLVDLMILPKGEEPFSSGSIKHKAMHYVVKVKIGGIAGLLASLLGKQPADMQIWVLGGEAPAFVKFEGPLYNGGPIWRVELAAPAGFP